MSAPKGLQHILDILPRTGHGQKDELHKKMSRRVSAADESGDLEAADTVCN